MLLIFQSEHTKPIKVIIFYFSYEKICFKIKEKDCVIKRATVNAIIDVRVIVIPVLNELKILELIVPSCLFKTLVVKSISVSTL